MACYIYLAAIGTPSYNQCLWTILMATSGAHCASACAYILVQVGVTAILILDPRP